MTTATSETERVRDIWIRTAPAYERSMSLEARLLGDRRAWAASLAAGAYSRSRLVQGSTLPGSRAATRRLYASASPRHARATRRASAGASAVSATIPTPS